MIRLWRLLALPVFLGLIFLGAYLYFYLGGYKDVVVDVVDQAEMQTVFTTHRGAYHQINAAITKVEEWAKSHGQTCLKTFGEYLDDPRQVDEVRLRSRAGCLLDEPLKTSALPEGFEVGSLPAGQYVHAVFTGSPAIGPWKVYPRLNDYVAQQKLQAGTSSIEIYKINADGKMTTEYLLPLVK